MKVVSLRLESGIIKSVFEHILLNRLSLISKFL